MSQHRKDSQDSAASAFRSRHVGGDPSQAMSPQVMEMFAQQVAKGIELGVKAAMDAQRLAGRKNEEDDDARSDADADNPRVLVVARDVPEGLAAAFLGKNGYYPDHTQSGELVDLYLKVQPALRLMDGFAARIAVAARNARAHISRIIKEALPAYFPHDVDHGTDLATVRLCCYFLTLSFILLILIVLGPVSSGERHGSSKLVPQNSTGRREPFGGRWTLLQSLLSQATAHRISPSPWKVWSA